MIKLINILFALIIVFTVIFSQDTNNSIQSPVTADTLTYLISGARQSNYTEDISTIMEYLTPSMVDALNEWNVNNATHIRSYKIYINGEQIPTEIELFRKLGNEYEIFTILKVAEDSFLKSLKYYKNNTQLIQRVETKDVERITDLVKVAGTTGSFLLGAKLIWDDNPQPVIGVGLICTGAYIMVKLGYKYWTKPRIESKRIKMQETRDYKRYQDKAYNETPIFFIPQYYSVDALKMLMSKYNQRIKDID